MNILNIKKKIKNINFLKLLIKTISLLKSGKDKKNLFLLILIVSFQAILEVLSLASIIPLMYLIQGPNVIIENINNLFIFEIFNYQFDLDSQLINIYIPIMVILIMVCSTFFRIFLIYKTNKLIEDTRHYISIRLLNNFLNSNEILNLDKSEIAKSILSEVDQFIIIVFQPTILMLTNLILLLGIVIYLTFTNFIGSLFALSILGSFYILFYKYSKKILNKSGLKSEESNKGRFRTAIESFTSIKDIRMYNAEIFFQNRFNKFSRSFADTNSTYTSLTASPKFILEMIVFVALAISTLFFTESNRTSYEILPLLGTFAFAAYKAQPSLSSVIFGINSLVYGSKIISNLDNNLKHKNEYSNNINLLLKDLKNQESCILIQNLYFSHSIQNSIISVLNNVNLKIKYKSFSVLIGESGAGKTTLLNLISGLIKPHKGEIIFNKNYFKDVKPRISYLHQDHTLFNSSVAQNVAFGVEENQINFDKLYAALKKAEIYKFIFKLKKNINTQVGENGSNFSQGQIQRIALARALYFDPDILILDEPTSSLDQKNEESIIKTLSKLSREITIIMSTHKLKSLPKDAEIFDLN